MSESPRAIVFTMKKVGSSSVIWALKQCGLRVDRATPDNIDAIDWEDAKIVTLVRDPIARNISEHFEVFQGNRMDYWFKAFADHDYPLRFFDYWFRHITGVDVFEHTFNTAFGWKVYEKRVLLLRLESLDHALWPGINELLGGPVMRSGNVHRAKGSERFGAEYEKFKESIGFDYSFLDVMYNNPYCRKFYSELEIVEMKRKWQKNWIKK